MEGNTRVLIPCSKYCPTNASSCGVNLFLFCLVRDGVSPSVWSASCTLRFLVGEGLSDEAGVVVDGCVLEVEGEGLSDEAGVVVDGCVLEVD